MRPISVVQTPAESPFRPCRTPAATHSRNLVIADFGSIRSVVLRTLDVCLSDGRLTPKPKLRFLSPQQPPFGVTIEWRRRVLTLSTLINAFQRTNSTSINADQRSDYNAPLRAITWSKRASTDFSCRASGLKTLKFSKSLYKESKACAHRPTRVRVGHGYTARHFLG